MHEPISLLMLYLTLYICLCYTPHGASSFPRSTGPRQPPAQQPPKQQLQVHGRGPLPLTPFPSAQPHAASASVGVPSGGSASQSYAAMPRLPVGPAPTATLPTAPASATKIFGGLAPSPSLASAPLRFLSPIGATTAEPLGSPLPRKLFLGGPSATSTPVASPAAAAAAGGMKRGRSIESSGGGASTGVTPLMGSGITNLAGGC